MLKINTKFYLLRHGEGQHQVDGIVPGINTSLTDLGREQVKDAAEVIKWLGITDILSSDELRAEQSVQIVQKVLRADGQNLPIQYSKQLREISFGDFERTDKFNIRFDAIPFDFHLNPHNYNAESYDDVFNRACDLIRQIKQLETEEKIGDNVLIVGHSVINTMLRYALLKGENTEFNFEEFSKQAGRTSNASIVKIDMSQPLSQRNWKLIHGDSSYKSKSIAERQRIIDAKKEK